LELLLLGLAEHKWTLISGEGLIDGFLKCSSEMPGEIDSLEDPS
jgi:hypothetical protein